MKIETFDCRGDSSRFGASLPEGLNQLQMVFTHGQRRLVIVLPDDAVVRHGIAMKLLQLDGMKVAVKLTREAPPCIVCGKPTWRKMEGGGGGCHQKCEPVTAKAKRKASGT